MLVGANLRDGNRKQSRFSEKESGQQADAYEDKTEQKHHLQRLAERLTECGQDIRRQGSTSGCVQKSLGSCEVLHVLSMQSICDAACFCGQLPG